MTRVKWKITYVLLNGKYLNLMQAFTINQRGIMIQASVIYIVGTSVASPNDFSDIVHWQISSSSGKKKKISLCTIFLNIFFNPRWILSNNAQGPVVQSVVSLTSLLRVISLTVLADSIHNILIFFAEKMWVAFALQKLLTFFQQKISAYLCITRCKF